MKSFFASWSGFLESFHTLSRFAPLRETKRFEMDMNHHIDHAA
jgi:hypothetical protein